jgi:hypothetical protein
MILANVVEVLFRDELVETKLFDGVSDLVLILVRLLADVYQAL